MMKMNAGKDFEGIEASFRESSGITGERVTLDRDFYDERQRPVSSSRISSQEDSI